MKKKIILQLFLISAMMLLCSCGKVENTNEAGKANEEFFVWDGNYIAGITEKGSSQTNIIIPARCEGFSVMICQGTDIEYVSFEDDDDVELGRAFMGAEKLVEVKLPSQLTKIRSFSFQMCKSLKTITIPSEVSLIEKRAFSACDSLESVLFEGEKLSTIEKECFEYCDSLKSIDIPEGVTKIEESAFFGCSSLENVTLAPSVSIIEQSAFGNTALTELYLPADMEIKEMNVNAFGMNTYDMTVYIQKDSWCDLNRAAWDVDFAEVAYME